MQAKHCSKCGELKTLGEFPKDHRRNPPRRAARCKSCKTAYENRWKAFNPEKYRALWKKKPPKRYAHLDDDDPIIVNGLRVCCKCKKEKPLNCFHRGVGSPFGRQRRCKVCNRLYNREQKKKKYGLLAGEFESLLAQQGGECAICEVVLAYDGVLPAVDHDHGDGTIRGILCRKCNSALGLFGDRLSTLRSAVRYLEKAAKSKSEIENVSRPNGQFSEERRRDEGGNASDG